jgi:hypothetical protein
MTINAEVAEQQKRSWFGEFCGFWLANCAGICNIAQQIFG